MNKYVNLILNKLLEKYENSKLSKEGSTRNIRISFKFDSKNMNDYVSEDSYQYEKLIEDAVYLLESKEIIVAERLKNGLIKKVSLNLNNIDSAYQIIGKESKNMIDRQYHSLLEQYSLEPGLVQSFCNLMISKIDSYKSHRAYFNSLDELKEILLILSKLENQQEEISIRNFSARYLNDSKRLEHIKSKITKIIKEIWKSNESISLIEDCDNMNADDILVKFNVFKNPTFIYIRGKGKFKVYNQEIDLNKMNQELILNSNHLTNLSILELENRNIITVENLATFYDFPIENSLVVYLGGFHNRVRRDFLLKLNRTKNNLKFYHSGDIDAGGFYILDHLIQKTKIPFEPIMMNKETLEKYRKYTKALTKEDRIRLNDLKKKSSMKEFYSTINYMLQNNIKLEQENIDYKDVEKIIGNENNANDKNDIKLN